MKPRIHPVTVSGEDADLLVNRTGRARHRVIMERILGRPLERGEIVDHIDRNPHDHCRDNLRLATRSQNAVNRPMMVNNRSGYRGVIRDPLTHRYKAMVCRNGVKYYLGTFDTAEEAHDAYCRKARELHGDFLPPVDAMRKDNDR